MSKKKPQKPLNYRKPLRKNRHVFTLNDLEQRALSRYFKKYKIENKSKFIREVLMREVIMRLEKDSPTLFETDND